MTSSVWGLYCNHRSLIQQRDSKISRTLCECKKINSEIEGL